MGEPTPGPQGPATGALAGVRRSARDLANGLDGIPRWQRLRAGFLGGWVLASLLALWIACPSTGPGNSLGVEVRVLTDSLVGGQQILVRNESDQVWTDLELTLDGTWKLAHRALRPREQLVLSPSQFDRQGEQAPRDLRARSIAIRCRQGSATLDLR